MLINKNVTYLLIFHKQSNVYTTDRNKNKRINSKTDKDDI